MTLTMTQIKKEKIICKLAMENDLQKSGFLA